ncbi:unnamed protein product [Calypogeia fissa]
MPTTLSYIPQACTRASSTWIYAGDYAGGDVGPCVRAWIRSSTRGREREVDAPSRWSRVCPLPFVFTENVTSVVEQQLWRLQWLTRRPDGGEFNRTAVKLS